MSLSIRVDAETGIAVVECFGVLRCDDARDSVVALWNTANWEGRAAAWDFRSAEFDLSTSDVQELAHFVLHNQPHPPPARVAFVTGRNVDFGMARMFEIYRRSPHTAFRVFRDFDEAMSWLHVGAGSETP